MDWDKAFGWLKAKTGADLAPEQADAVKLALTRKVAVLTGGPGCGKSFTVRSVVELARARKAKVVLAAPTGRAAKRLAELTGHEAATIHRLLKLQPGGDPEFDADNPLDADLVVIDETSMVDVILANKLVKAVAPGAHLLLVGDVDQLPSVGAGEVLRDLISAHPPGGPADEDLPAGAAVRHRRQRPQGQRRTPARADRVPRLLLVQLRRDRGHRGPGRRHRRPPHPRQVRPRPPPRRPGPVPDAPRPGRGGQPQPAAAGGPHPLPGRRARAALRRPGVPRRRQGHPAAQQLRQGHAGIFNGTTGVVTGMSLEDHALTVRTDEDEESPTTSTSSTSSPTPTRSPSTAPRARSTPPSSSPSRPAPG